MSKLSIVGFARLTMMVEEHGEDDVLAMISSRIAEGEEPGEVAISMGLTPTVLRKWLEDDDNRMAEVLLARRCYGDKLAYKGIRVVDDAVMEEVPLAKLKSDKYERMAGKLDRAGWGDAKDAGGGGGITVVVNRGGVVSIGDGMDKGYQSVVMPVIEGELVNDIQENGSA